MVSWFWIPTIVCSISIPRLNGCSIYLRLVIGDQAPELLGSYVQLPSRDAKTIRPQLELKQSDGQVASVLDLSVSPLTNADGGLIGKMGVIRDITLARTTEQALHQYNTRLFLLRNIDRAILASMSIDEIAKATITQLRDIIELDWIGLTQFYSEQNQAAILTFWSRKPSRLEDGFRFHCTEAEFMQGITPLKSEPAGASEGQPSGPLPEYWQREGYETFMHLQLMTNGRLIGSLGIARSDTESFSSEDVEIAQEVAAQIAIAMQNKRLFDVTQRRASQLELAAEIAQEVTSVHDLDELLNRAVHRVSEKF